MRERPIGVLLAGAVRHAADYAPLIDAHPRFRLVGIAEDSAVIDWRRDRGRHLARAYDVPFEELGVALRRDDVELGVVATEPTRHAEGGLAVLSAGKHLLVDKPVATSADDAARLASASRADAVATYVHRLFSPALMRLRAYLESGGIGVPLSLQLHWTSANAVEDEGGEVVVDPALSGGGELWNFLGYPLDTVQWLTGLEIERVFASATNVTSASHRQHGVESLATVNVELERGVQAAIAVGRGPAVGGAVFTTTVVGSHGFAAVDEDRPSVDLACGAASAATAIPDDDLFAVTFNGLLDDLAAAIREGTPVCRMLADGCATAAAIAAAVRSAADGRPVSLNR